MEPQKDASSQRSNNSSDKYYKNCIKKASWILRNVSLEPMVFLTIFASMTYQLIVQNLYLEKACRVEIGFNTSICDAMTNREGSGYSPDQERDVQKIVSKMMALRSFIQGFFPVFILLFAGSWSDRHNKRKPLILLPILGEILCCISLIINTIFFYELPLILTTLGDSLFFSLMGGWPCLLTGVYSYVGTRTDEHNRTMKIGFVSASSMAASIIGSSSAGIIFKSAGFIPSFSICITLFTVALLLGKFVVEDNKTKDKNEKSCNFFKEVFHIKYITGVFKIFRKGVTCRIIVILLAGVMTVGPWYGEVNLNYMYTRMKFKWTAVDYSIFSGIQFIVQVTGVLVAIVLFSKILKFKDATLGIIAHTGAVTASLIYATASEGKYFFVGAVCDNFHMSAQVAVRSLLSKTVAPNELCQANSLFALSETALTMIFGPMYSTIYKFTLDIYPGIYFFISACTRFIGICIFTWLYANTSRNKTILFGQKREERVICGDTNLEK
ncbi:hypothetical protein WA026_000912 [Henosepilachna vigintioctopunctata]|uniref:Proton-coupled folate transporter n=1 Tax=Henosepilachna vigintioctopunctata TaxID=420089 RepID=A0AAW1V7F7_9CUCU